jgi:hypothetical protein
MAQDNKIVGKALSLETECLSLAKTAAVPMMTALQILDLPPMSNFLETGPKNLWFLP